MALESLPNNGSFNEYLHIFKSFYIENFINFIIKSDVKCNSIKGLTDDEKYCWEWTGAKTWNGYGRFWYDGKTVRAHRFAYALFVGKIPDNLVIDHLCRNEWCINHKHLEPVTQKENTNRGLSGFLAKMRQLNKTHCPQNHPYSPENTYRSKKNYRSCKECKKEYYLKKISSKGILTA